MPTHPSDAELLARQDALQAAADDVVADLGLMRILEAIGQPIRTGSAALGLRVACDIDMTTLCPSLDATAIFTAATPLAGHPRVQRMLFRNDTGRWNTDAAYPDGLYWMVQYVAADRIPWNLDLWFLREGTTQFDLEHVQTLPRRLTTETRATILRMKQALVEDPPAERIPSYAIYAAVLDDHVATLEDFLARRTGQR